MLVEESAEAIIWSGFHRSLLREINDGCLCVQEAEQSNAFQELDLISK